MEIDHKITYMFCNEILCCMLTITNMVVVQIFQVVSDKVNVIEICDSGTYAHK